MASALTIQVVLFHNSLEEIRRLLKGLLPAVAKARSEGSLAEVNLKFGDSGTTRSLDDAAFADLSTDARAVGFNDVTYEFFGENLGSGGGSNRLADGGDSPLLLVLNPDTYPDPWMLHHMLSRMEDDSIGAVDARQVPCQHPKDWSKSGDTSWVAGAAMMVRRQAFNDVGGFAAEFFPMYCDDVDFSWRLRLAGWRTVHAPRAILFHDKRPMGGGVVPQPTEQYWAALAKLLMCRRWNRADLEAQTVRDLTNSSCEPYHQALAEYRSREQAGALPTPIADAAKVATFAKGDYAPHLF